MKDNFCTAPFWGLQFRAGLQRAQAAGMNPWKSCHRRNSRADKGLVPLLKLTVALYSDPSKNVINIHKL